MRRSITPLAVVLIVQLALALLLMMRHDPLAGVKSDTPLLQTGVTKATDELVIEGKPPAAASPTAGPPGPVSTPASTPQSSRIVLRKKDAVWVLPDAYDAPADSAKVMALLERLGALKRGLPIATSESALRRFKLVDAEFERRLVLSGGGKTLGTVYLGSSPGLRKSDARTAADRAVYAVDLPTYDVPTDLVAWLDPGLLKGDAAQLAELTIAAGTGPHEPLALIRQKGTDKQPDAWTASGLKPDQHLDSARVEALVQDLAGLRLDAVLGTTADAAWQQDHPALQLTLKDEKSQSVQWTLSKPASGDFYVLKSSAHPWYFSISASEGKQILDASGREALMAVAKPGAGAPGKS